LLFLEKIRSRGVGVAAVPEPSTWAMMLLGFAALVPGLPSEIEASTDCGLIHDHQV
jgi:hypothetical protein